MLKYAIDVYNFLLDIVDFIKKPSLKSKSFLIGLGAALAVAVSLVSVQAMSGSNADELTRQPGSGQALPLSDQPSSTKSTANKAAGNPSATEQANTDTDTSSKKSATGAAGAVSPDSPASHNIHLPVTRNGQYEPGTLIVYDAIKDDKTYYAGDLISGVGSVTISKSDPNLTANTLVVSSPDAANISIPAVPTDDTSPYFTISLDAAQANEAGNSYHMVVELKDQEIKKGTYQLHVAASRSAQTTSAWWYHGFLTVNVVD